MEERIGAKNRSGRSRRRASTVDAATASCTGDFAWHSAARNAEKSCVPTSARAASRIAATSSGRWYQPTRPARSAGRAGTREQAGTCSGAPSAAKRAWNSAATGCAHSTATSARQMRVDAAHPGGVGRAPRRCRSGRSASSRARPRRCGRPRSCATGASAIAASARSSASCTPRPSGCDCQPVNGAPSVFESEGDAHDGTIA